MQLSESVRLQEWEFLYLRKYRQMVTWAVLQPLGLKIEGANRHDMKLTRPTIESLIIEREDAHQGASLKQFLSIDGQS